MSKPNPKNNPNTNTIPKETNQPCTCTSPNRYLNDDTSFGGSTFTVDSLLCEHQQRAQQQSTAEAARKQAAAQAKYKKALKYFWDKPCNCQGLLWTLPGTACAICTIEATSDSLNGVLERLYSEGHVPANAVVSVNTSIKHNNLEATPAYWKNLVNATLRLSYAVNSLVHSQKELQLELQAGMDALDALITTKLDGVPKDN
ncbi:hypothetical protein F5Y16DRAFT_400313 [Xylariaceae sp. FL0255]|nr:hypothetical protein F5Y16DRAFT_400313 [Xylariaceae sp. FL0255]